MENESGTDSGLRGIGRLAVWSIPLSLGAAACIWLGFLAATHDWMSLLRQEERRAVYVGAEKRPKEPLKILAEDFGCVKIIKADIEGAAGTVYVQNQCRVMHQFLRLEYKVLSPDGTVIYSEWNYLSVLGGPDNFSAGEKAELVFGGYHELKVDDRAVTIKFRVYRD